MAGKYEKFKLPKRIKAKWLKALRSGEYTQGKNALLEEHVDYSQGHPEHAIKQTYCCLGVLGSVCGLNEDEMVGAGTLEDENWVEELPMSWMEPAFDEETPVMVRYNGDKLTIQGVLATKNDRGDSFEKIANFIEKYL